MSRAPSCREFPHLFQAVAWGPVRCQFELCSALPPVREIGNVNVVPFVGDRVLLIQLVDGLWDIPGGTLEPGEGYMDTLQRELLEEAGARLLTFQAFGAWHCHSLAPVPYRPHLPHPRFYRLVGHGQVELLGAPTNPVGDEQVTGVACVSVEEAGRRFCTAGRKDLAELYWLAEIIRSGHQER